MQKTAFPYMVIKTSPVESILQLRTPNMSEAVSIYPVAPRLKNNPTPHVGPTINEYKALHAQTIGPGSDEWWTKAGLCIASIKRMMPTRAQLWSHNPDCPRDAALGQALSDCAVWQL